ncbi:DUF1876 domain-containing protein [Catelliglobosispora koreensis]|uniref:DUF1876 domain-containing protein n=1 Tax=Catelliglobosispora koreensis TaxID=129052 RepID=UPI000377B7F4|nr:DUF1876 domain-containing protein [Catelliglobosispora koreensis]
MGTWTVELAFAEDTEHTEAIAILRIPDGREVRGLGQAKRDPADRPVAEIGEEIAGARALSSLAHELLNVAAAEVEKNVRRDDPLG